MGAPVLSWPSGVSPPPQSLSLFLKKSVRIGDSPVSSVTEHRSPPPRPNSPPPHPTPPVQSAFKESREGSSGIRGLTDAHHHLERRRLTSRRFPRGSQAKTKDAVGDDVQAGALTRQPLQKGKHLDNLL